MGLLPRYFVILAVCTVCVSCKALPLPSYMSACYRNDPKLNECATKSGRAALPTLVKGDRKYGIPLLDPMEVNELAIARGNGPVSVDLTVNNVKIYGLVKTEIKWTKFDLDEKTITVKMFNPSLQVIGDYNVNGRVLVLPISGTGFCNLTLDNNDFMYILKYNLIKKADGLDYVAPTDYNMTGKPTGLHIRLDNLFNGNKALSDSMNQLLNENWEEICDELAPMILEAFGLVLQQVVTNAVRDVPYDVIFPVKP